MQSFKLKLKLILKEEWVFFIHLLHNYSTENTFILGLHDSSSIPTEAYTVLYVHDLVAGWALSFKNYVKLRLQKICCPVEIVGGY